MSKPVGGVNYIKAGAERFIPPTLKLDQALSLWELLHPLMHCPENPGDVAAPTVSDPVFEAERDLYMMLTNRLILEASLGGMTISETERALVEKGNPS